MCLWLVVVNRKDYKVSASLDESCRASKPLIHWGDFFGDSGLLPSFPIEGAGTPQAGRDPT